MHRTGRGRAAGCGPLSAPRAPLLPPPLLPLFLSSPCPCIRVTPSPSPGRQPLRPRAQVHVPEAGAARSCSGWRGRSQAPRLPGPPSPVSRLSVAGWGGHKEGRRGRLVASCSPFSLEETPRPKYPRSALGTMPSACCWTRPVGATLRLPPRRGPCPSLSLRISPPPASQPLRLPLLTPQHPCCALASRWPPGSTVPETPALEPTCQPRLLLSVTAAEISPRACVFSCLFTYPGRQNGGGGPVAPPSCLRNQEDRGSVLPLQTEPSPAPLPAHCGLGRPTASRSSVSPSGGGGAT